MYRPPCLRIYSDLAQETKAIYDKLRRILLGQESIKLYLEFLKRNNKVDMLILKNTKVGYVLLLSEGRRTDVKLGLSGAPVINIPCRTQFAECFHALGHDF